MSLMQKHQLLNMLLVYYAPPPLMLSMREGSKNQNFHRHLVVLVHPDLSFTWKPHHLLYVLSVNVRLMPTKFEWL